MQQRRGTLGWPWGRTQTVLFSGSITPSGDKLGLMGGVCCMMEGGHGAGSLHGSFLLNATGGRRQQREAGGWRGGVPLSVPLSVFGCAHPPAVGSSPGTLVLQQGPMAGLAPWPRLSCLADTGVGLLRASLVAERNSGADTMGDCPNIALCLAQGGHSVANSVTFFFAAVAIELNRDRIVDRIAYHEYRYCCLLRRWQSRKLGTETQK